jgi:hypothetical protein
MVPGGLAAQHIEFSWISMLEYLVGNTIHRDGGLVRASPCF